MWEGFFGAVLGTAGTLVTAGVALYIFRKQAAAALSASQAKQSADEKEKLCKSIEPLYKDLGTLMHYCNKCDFDASMAQLEVMDERRQRGEYDMPKAPVIIQNECLNMLTLFQIIRSAARQNVFQNEQAKSYLVQGIVQQLAAIIQNNLSCVRNGQV